MDSGAWWATVYGVVKSQIGEGNGTPLQSSCLEKCHGWRSLVGCSPWGRWESDMTERLHFHFSLSCIGEGNGNLLQCSCLENPRVRRAWWAAVYGVTQSQTRLKWLGSSSKESDMTERLTLHFSIQALLCTRHLAKHFQALSYWLYNNHLRTALLLFCFMHKAQNSLIICPQSYQQGVAKPGFQAIWLQSLCNAFLCPNFVSII